MSGSFAPSTKTESMAGLKAVTYAKISSKMVNPRDIAGERIRRMVNPRDIAGERRRRRRRMVNPRDIAGKGKRRRMVNVE